MLGKFVSSLSTALDRGNRYRLVLGARSDGFALQLFHGQAALPFSRAVEKFEPLTRFRSLPVRPDGSAVVRLGLLEEAKTVLGKLGGEGLEVVIAPAAASMRLEPVPPGFKVEYRWAASRPCVVSHISGEAISVGNGWFVAGNRYWHVEGTTPEDLDWLSRFTVEGPDIVKLVRDIAPDWCRRGLPFVSRVQYCEQSALALRFARVEEDQVEFDIEWRVPTTSLRDLPSLPDHVAAGNLLVRGISPRALLHTLPRATGRVRLTGHEIRRFVQETWPTVAAFACGNTADFLRLHDTVPGEKAVVLDSKPEGGQGLGAVPNPPTNEVHAGPTEVERPRPTDQRLAEVLVDGAEAPGGLPIPPREPAVVACPSAEVAAVRIELPDPSTLSGPYSTIGQDGFLADAYRLVNHREEQARFVPFADCWPTYADMTEDQKKWYFYWRGQVRDGNCVDTDLTYIFVHLYELINSVGVKNPKDGYQQLRRLWVGYRDRYPKLDRYLVDWIVDYVLVNGGGEDALKEHLETLPRGAVVRNPDVLLGYYLDGPLTRLPLGLIEALTDYPIQQGRLFLVFLDGCADLMRKAIPTALDAVNGYLLQTAGLGIFDLYKPASPETFQRHFFDSAVYVNCPTRVATITAFRYSRHAPLREFLTSLVKQTESKVRRLRGYRWKPEDVPLEPGIQKVVEEAVASVLGVSTSSPRSQVTPDYPLPTRVAPRPPEPRVVIDMSRVEDLRRESEELREILLGGNEAEDRNPQPSAPPQPPEPDCRIEAPSTMEQPPASSTDRPPAQELVARLGADETRLIHALAERGWIAASSDLEDDLAGALLGPLVDRINEFAFDLLGDIFIAVEDEVLVASEDFLDDMSRAILPEPVPNLKASEVVTSA